MMSNTRLLECPQCPYQHLGLSILRLSARMSDDRVIKHL